jgi:hypothetical protein
MDLLNLRPLADMGHAPNRLVAISYVEAFQPDGRQSQSGAGMSGPRAINPKPSTSQISYQLIAQPFFGKRLPMLVHRRRKRGIPKRLDDGSGQPMF